MSTYSSVCAMRRDGAGYTSRAWRTSPLLAKVRTLDDDARVYTNGMIAVAFLTGRWHRGVPEPVDRLTGRRFGPTTLSNRATA